MKQTARMIIIIPLLALVVFILQMDVSSNKTHYKTMEVTAYCPCEICCGVWADGITASGINVKNFNGLLIAAPPEYKFGTVMDIPGYGIATVQDRGGAIKGNRLDVFFPTHQEALNWGRQTLKVKIIEEYKNGKQ